MQDLYVELAFVLGYIFIRHLNNANSKTDYYTIHNVTSMLPKVILPILTICSLLRKRLLILAI